MLLQPLCQMSQLILAHLSKSLPTSALESIPTALTCITKKVLTRYPASWYFLRRIQLLHCFRTDAYVELKMRKLLFSL